MDLIGRLRETDAGNAVFATDTLSAGGHVDLLLQTAVQETDPVGVVAGITFTVTQEPVPHTAGYVNTSGPMPGRPRRLIRPFTRTRARLRRLQPPMTSASSRQAAISWWSLPHRA